MKIKVNNYKNIFLDRDGIINEIILRDNVVTSPRKIDEFIFRDEIFDFFEAIERESKMIFVVTNQPELSRGLLPLNELEEMHRKIEKELSIDEIIFCPHDNHHNCGCRKPKPGMINSMHEKYNLNKHESILFGDSEKDIGAANAAKIDGVLLKTTYNKIISGNPFIESLLDVI